MDLRGSKSEYSTNKVAVCKRAESRWLCVIKCCGMENWIWVFANKIPKLEISDCWEKLNAYLPLMVGLEGLSRDCSRAKWKYLIRIPSE